tara:strand:- start:1996 stop:3147 length:1152 start_codon:yes stop_codon:yes gene_type:complete
MKKILKSVLNYFFLYPRFIIVYCLLEIISVFLRYKPKFFKFVESEIGSITWVDGYLRRKRYFKNQYNSFCLFTGPHTANIFVNQLVEKHLSNAGVKIIKNKFINNLIEPIFFFNNKFLNNEYSIPSCKEYANLPKVNWLENNEKDLKKELADFFGIDKEDWFVCFFARDSYYDKKFRPNMKNVFELRNADINTFIPAMEFIASKGGYAIRVGSYNEQNLRINGNKHIINYSTFAEKEAKIDVLLMLLCEFAIGTGSGIMDIANLNDIPHGLVNQMQYINPQGMKYGSFIPKIFRKKSGEVLKLNEYEEIYKHYPKLTIQKHVQILQDNQLTYLNNSPEDLLQMTKDFYFKYIEKKEVPCLEESKMFNIKGLNIYEPFYLKYLK